MEEVAGTPSLSISNCIKDHGTGQGEILMRDKARNMITCDTKPFQVVDDGLKIPAGFKKLGQQTEIDGAKDFKFREPELS